MRLYLLDANSVFGRESSIAEILKMSRGAILVVGQDQRAGQARISRCASTRLTPRNPNVHVRALAIFESVSF
jgi:predicted alpha/beta superfamily hydrolase